MLYCALLLRIPRVEEEVVQRRFRCGLGDFRLGVTLKSLMMAAGSVSSG